MNDFVVAVWIYVVIGLVIATYEIVTMPAFDEDDEKLWNEDEVSKHMDFPKKPKLFFFCVISLAWPLHLLTKWRNR